MRDELFSVKDQVVLVSGASRGIGRAIAAGFAARGARIIISGREEQTLVTTAREIGTDESPVTPLVCDVASRDSIEALVKQTIQRFGHVDTLINVAGVNKRMPAERYTEEEFDFILDINLKGAFLLSQSVGKHMLTRGQGVQINTVSLNNDRPLTNVLPYAASKAALGHITRSLAAEWGPRGIRVNAIAPGFILTDLTRKLWSDPGMQAWGQTNTPLKRLGVPEDLVGVAIFLASPASAFMTGQIVYVDGGFSAGLTWPIPPS